MTKIDRKDGAEDVTVDARAPYERPRIEKKRAVSRVTLFSGSGFGGGGSSAASASGSVTSL